MYRSRRILESAQGRFVYINGKKLLNFCSNDYLGLAGDTRVAEALADGAARWGTGSGASHLISGHTQAHHDLENALAEFTGRPRALLYSSGYAANVGVINALLTRGDFVFEDRLNHASLLDGGWISRAKFRWFKHRNVRHLTGQLRGLSDSPRRKLIVSDGTFSMDGDRADVAALSETVQDHNAWLMIDDAHGIGVHGRSGVGSIDPQTYSCDEVHVLVGTLGKAFGTHGAFVAGSDSLIETLIQRSRNYIFTTALPSAVAVATMKSLEIVKEESWRRERLAELVQQFRSSMSELGFTLMDSSSPIQPIVVGEPSIALRLSEALEKQGLLVTAIRPPTVPEGTSRLRVTFSAAHETEDVDRLVDALDQSGCLESSTE